MCSGKKMVCLQLFLLLVVSSVTDSYEQSSSIDNGPLKEDPDGSTYDIFESLDDSNMNPALLKPKDGADTFFFKIKRYCSWCLRQTPPCSDAWKCMMYMEAMKWKRCIPCPSTLPGIQCDPSCQDTDTFKLPAKHSVYENSGAPAPDIAHCWNNCSATDGRIGCLYLCLAHQEIFNEIQEALLQSDENDMMNDKNEQKSLDRSDKKRGFPVFSGKRGFPVFSGKRGFPVFSGKRGFPVFSGKRGFPMFNGKRGFPMFSGKRGFPVFSGKRGFPVFSGKRGFPMFSGKRGFPMFSGKRGFPVFSGKRGFPIFGGKRGFPMFSAAGKRSFTPFVNEKGMELDKRGFPIFSAAGKRSFPLFLNEDGVELDKRGFPIFQKIKRGFPVFLHRRSLNEENKDQKQFLSNESREIEMVDTDQSTKNAAPTQNMSYDDSEPLSTLKRGFPISQLVLHHRGVGRMNKVTLPKPNIALSTIKGCLDVCKATSSAVFWLKNKVDCTSICSLHGSLTYRK
ncbi:uncharacterized protein LOC106151480 isoform X2 [Lingula anatina]|uniref:Uncharacterized protein LOC106151480 isoform X2 n=1 Tax=Lingula anatina TaxID=7574 RepID=A0A1S3H4Z1_LINAN|nr:uncharacterized protein LOC106151480 isoform X2 [Lingula anatina]|eukprot:XP_013380204.1 uncharacterized protein LOC106151480 isoform X2 [Lingula anatina]